MRTQNVIITAENCVSIGGTYDASFLPNAPAYFRIGTYAMNAIPKREQAAFQSRKIAKADAELLKRCQRGDQSAWDALVDRYQRLNFQYRGGPA